MKAIFILLVLLYASFLTLSIISLFSPRIGGFWFKYLKLKEPTRLKAFFLNFGLFVLIGIFAIPLQPIDYRNNGMTALNNLEYTKAIKQFSKMETGSERQALIDKTKNEAKKYYAVKIKNSITNLDTQGTSSLIDEMMKVTGESTVDKEKTTIMINDEASKQYKLMFQAEKEGNYSQAKQYAEKLKKLEKFKSEASNKIAFYDNKISAEMERKKAEAEKLNKLQAIKQAEEEMTKQLEANKQADAAAEASRINAQNIANANRAKALRTPDAKRDIIITNFEWKSVYGQTQCKLNLRNNNPYITYKDIRLQFKYYGESGTEIKSLTDSFLEYPLYKIIRPNENKYFEFAIEGRPQQYRILPVITGSDTN